MDIEMPVMDGIETMALIANSEDKRIRETPVVALTGNVGEEDRQRYKDTGMRDCLAKPIDPERLRNIVFAYGRPVESLTPSETDADTSAAHDNSGFSLSDDELDEDSFGTSVDFSAALAPQTATPVTQEADMDSMIFDAPIMASLRQSLGIGQLKEMMTGVFAHNRSVLPTMQTAFKEADKETLRGCAHELKGMNGNFGLKAISTLSATIEHVCRYEDAPFESLGAIISQELPAAMDKTEKLFSKM
jgi:CheY-like chemotaxis protein